MGPTTTTKLAELQKRVVAWRGAHGGKGHRGTPFPEELWSEAVRVAEQAGVSATARALRLNAGRLGKRVKAAAAQVHAAESFVEVGALPGAGQGAAHTVIELSASGGTRMRIELGAHEDLAGLSAALWRQLR